MSLVKAALRRARDAERKRRRRAEDPQLREREAAARRQRRAEDPQREAAAIRQRRAEDPQLREREAAARRKRRQENPDGEAACKRQRREADLDAARERERVAQAALRAKKYASPNARFKRDFLDRSFGHSCKVTADAGTQANLSTGVIGIGKSKAVQVVHLSGKNIGIQVNLNMKMSKEKGTQVSENKRRRRRRR